MGSTCEKINVKNYEDNQLTLDEVGDLVNMWKKIGDLEEFALNIAIRIFTAYPDLRTKWGIDNSIKNDEIRENSRIQNHTKRFAMIMNDILNNYNKFNKLNSEKLIELGAGHKIYDIKKEHFKLFQKCFMITLETTINNSNFFNEKVRQAWNKFFNLIIMYMAAGLESN